MTDRLKPLAVISAERLEALRKRAQDALDADRVYVTVAPHELLALIHNFEPPVRVTKALKEGS